jgi:hypothetical protein
MKLRNTPALVLSVAVCSFVALLATLAQAKRQEAARPAGTGIQVEAFGPDGKTVDPWAWKSGAMTMQIVPGRSEYLYVRDVDYGQAHDVIVRKVLAVIHKPEVIKLRVSAEMSVNVAALSSK